MLFFISAYSAVRVKMYAYVKFLGWIDLITVHTNKLLTRYFPERKAIAASLQPREVNHSFGKGFHVLNHLMTGRCPRKSLQLRPKFHSLFLQNSFVLKNATFYGLKSSPRLYWCKFQPWKLYSLIRFTHPIIITITGVRLIPYGSHISTYYCTVTLFPSITCSCCCRPSDFPFLCYVHFTLQQILLQQPK